MSHAGSAGERTPEIRERIRIAGLRWTPQRRVVVDVLARTVGHVTGSEIVERCRAIDPELTPSTVYRTLDALELAGVVRHAHGYDGREEYHVLPEIEHGHLHCAVCRRTWEIAGSEAQPLVAALATSRGFRVDMSHLTIVGTCAECAGRSGSAAPG